ncbi:MAG TPA: RNA-binding protein [Anaerolineaceae bacterium]|nr:RNA-binding protein [Anaerolineaceae bacterium]HPN51228.1 RNA-binding protein [Anaerolineaceae bacterium]
MNIYVGNISFKADEEGLRQTFGAFGQVASVAIIKDQATQRSRGFGFVEMPNDAEGQAAIAGLNGKEWLGRPLVVNEARPRAPREGGGAPRTGGYRPRSGGQGGGYGQR